METVRLDKWLWAARFFKSRSLATQACELGRVSFNGQATKPSRELRVGDMLLVKTPAGDFQMEVLRLSDMRGPAPVAQTLYRETDASKEARRKVADERRAMPRIDAVAAGKPSKRDRRKLEHFRGRD